MSYLKAKINFKKNKFTQNNYSDERKESLNVLLSFDEHQWIRNDSYLTRVFISFLMDLPSHIWEYFPDKTSLRFIYIREFYGLTVNKNQLNNIIIFPLLFKLLKSARPELGLAILAHELGHIYHAHHLNHKSHLDDQFEADLFSCQLGYSIYLLEILSEYPNSRECKERINRIKKYIRSNEQPQFT